MDELEYTERLAPTGLELDNQAKAFLNETAKWAKFLAIFGFVLIGLFMIFGLFMLSSLDMFSRFIPNFENSGGLLGVGMGLFYIFLTVLYLYPIWKLFEFANFSKKALNSNDSHLLTQALESQKSLFKFMGILMILLLCFYACMFLFTLGSFAFL